MAWTAIGLDENTGKVRWWDGSQEQFLPQGQDPNAGSGPNLYGWDPNMAVPEGGFTLGQLLAPNYFSQGTTLDDPAALAAAARDVAPGYTGPLDMNARVPNSQVRAPAKDNGFESLLGMGAMAGLGYLSGGFGIGSLLEGGGMGDWFSNLFGDSSWGTTYPSSIAPNVDSINPSYWSDAASGWGSTTPDSMWTPEQAQQYFDNGGSQYFKDPSAIQQLSKLVSNSLGGQAAGGLFGSSGSGLFGGLNTGSLLGGGLGALLGAMNGTKKIDDAVTTESGYNSVLSPAAQDEMLKTIRGDYLNPDTNPYLKQTYDRAAGEIGARLSPSFGHMEAFGQNSGWQNAYGRSLADLGTSLYGGNYNQERNRQFGAANAAPNYMKRSTTPVYSNPLGGMFSGAMAGGLLGGKLFGG